MSTRRCLGTPHHSPGHSLLSICRPTRISASLPFPHRRYSSYNLTTTTPQPPKALGTGTPSNASPNSEQHLTRADVILSTTALPSASDTASRLRACYAVAGASAFLAMVPTAAFGSTLGDSPEALSASNPFYDGAGIVARGTQSQLSSTLAELERETGWRVRVLTFSDPSAAPSVEALREAWRPDRRTVVIQFDPSAPNIIAFPYIGDGVAAKLRRPFWSELQTRYGNIFYMRQEGEQAAVENSLAAVTGCLRDPSGCTVVPGLPEEQYNFTLATSVAGGLVAGFVSRLEPQGMVRRRWVWLLLFSPLWGSLFINFGLGPILSRTGDLTPVIANCIAFAVASASPWALTALLGRQPPSSSPGQ